MRQSAPTGLRYPVGIPWRPNTTRPACADATWSQPATRAPSGLPTLPGDVGRGFRFLVKASWVNVSEKSCSWADSVPACTEGLSWTFNFPNRFPEKQRASNGKSGSPQPRISSVCVVIKPTARPDFRKMKYWRIPDDDTSKRRPTLDGDSTEFAT